ncbi:MAG: hypothetical protein ACO3C1_01240 [Ilumatobacteraceae bacterium]
MRRRPLPTPAHRPADRSVRRRLVGLVLAVAATVGPLATATTASASTSMRISWSGLSSSKHYGIGIDWVYPDGTGPGSGYEQYYEYPTSLYNNNTILPNPIPVSSAATLGLVRIEMYQSVSGTKYNAWTAGSAAIALRVPTTSSTANTGTLRFPTAGATGTGALSGTIHSGTTIADGRVKLSLFQVTGQPVTSTGIKIDAFSASSSIGTAYQTSPLWNGRYVAFIRDTATSRAATGFITINGPTTFALDLAQYCFGIDECQWSGTQPTPGGEFHSVTPTRIVDTRLDLGITDAVAPGDGRSTNGNVDVRLATKRNHEFQLTGQGGLPLVGISAALVTVTVTGGTAAGSMRLVPKPGRTNVWDEMTMWPVSYRDPLAVTWTSGDTRRSTYLIAPGSGGKVRLQNNSSAAVHVIVDVVGWIDSSQPGQDGSRVVTLSPSRVLDSRNGTGTEQLPFGATETRVAQLVGRAGIPNDAQGVLGTLTVANATGRTSATVWPNGDTRPGAAVLTTAGQMRSNLVTAEVGTGGDWQLGNSGSSCNYVLDVTGYLAAATGTAGDTTPAPAQAKVTGGVLGPGAERAVAVGGTGGVPSTATAAWVMLTVTSPTTSGSATLWADGTARPTVISMTWAAGQQVAGLVLVPLGTNGAFRLRNGTGSATYSATLLGWVS